MRTCIVCSLLVAALAGPSVVAAEPEWKAGVAVKVITPAELMWMAGYGHRNKPAEGKKQDLYVKALALEDADGGRLVLLTSDLVGIPRELSEAVSAEVTRRTKLPRERLMLTVSHTHCGPVLRNSLSDMYDMPADEAKKVGPYTDQLKEWMVEVIVKAIADLKPARLAHGQGTARFAVNRRQPTKNGIINGTNPDGPVDHDVPVLRIDGAVYQEMIGTISRTRHGQREQDTHDGTKPILDLIEANNDALLVLKMAKAHNSICPHRKHDPQHMGIKKKSAGPGVVSFGFTAFQGSNLS
jgi:hypothetical protein